MLILINIRIMALSIFLPESGINIEEKKLKTIERAVSNELDKLFNKQNLTYIIAIPITGADILALLRYNPYWEG